MSLNYAYNYAEVNNVTGWCLGVVTNTDPNFAGSTNGEVTYVTIPVYDQEYLFKYYNWSNGQWYEDAAFTIPWQSSLI